MKTGNSKPRQLPRPLKFLVFIISISVVCLPNWIALRAGKPVMVSADPAISIPGLITEDIEPEIELRNWMVETSEFRMPFYGETEIQFEDWMLDFGPTLHFAGQPERDRGNSAENLKPASAEWLHDFDVWGFRDSRVRF